MMVSFVLYNIVNICITLYTLNHMIPYHIVYLYMIYGITYYLYYSICVLPLECVIVTMWGDFSKYIHWFLRVLSI